MKPVGQKRETHQPVVVIRPRVGWGRILVEDFIGRPAARLSRKRTVPRASRSTAFARQRRMKGAARLPCGA